MTLSRLPLRLLAPVVVAPILVGCGGGSQESNPGEAIAKTSTDPRTPVTVSELRQRPLEVPGLQPGDSCPVSRPRTVSPDFAPGLGDGPVYPVGFAKGSVLEFVYPPQKKSPFAGSKWGGQKVLWVSHPNYKGPILIRGRQMDGTHEVRFAHGGDLKPRAELSFQGGETVDMTGGWSNFPSYTRLRAPGCYGYQVDGDGFRDVIVFRAVLF